MPIDFYYHIASTPCRSILLLSKLLDVELNLIEIDIIQKKHLTLEFLKINPQHCVPTLVDDGYILWESRAILGYLVHQYGKDDSLYPVEAKKRGIVDQRLYFDIGTLGPKLKEYLVSIRDGNADDESKIAKLEEALHLLDNFLEGQDWVAGDSMTIADISISVSIGLFELMDYDISKFLNISRWYPRMKDAFDSFNYIQNAAGVELKKFMVDHATTHK